MGGGADNELIYVNSLKMKLSVLFGVLQMFVGVCLKWSNAFHEKSLTDFICTFHGVKHGNLRIVCWLHVQRLFLCQLESVRLWFQGGASRNRAFHSPVRCHWHRLPSRCRRREGPIYFRFGPSLGRC